MPGEKAVIEIWQLRMRESLAYRAWSPSIGETSAFLPLSLGKPPEQQPRPLPSKAVNAS